VEYAGQQSLTTGCRITTEIANQRQSHGKEGRGKFRFWGVPGQGPETLGAFKNKKTVALMAVERFWLGSGGGGKKTISPSAIAQKKDRSM